MKKQTDTLAVLCFGGRGIAVKLIDDPDDVGLTTSALILIRAADALAEVGYKAEESLQPSIMAAIQLCSSLAASALHRCEEAA